MSNWKMKDFLLFILIINNYIIIIYLNIIIINNISVCLYKFVVVFLIYNMYYHGLDRMGKTRGFLFELVYRNLMFVFKETVYLILINQTNYFELSKQDQKN